MMVFLSVTTIACKDDDEAFGPPQPPEGNWPVRLSFDVDNQALVFDSVLYTNAAGNNYGIHLLQFYLSGFEFTDASGEKFSSDTVVYADARDPSTLTFNLKGIPQGSYTGLTFLSGWIPHTTPAIVLRLTWPI